MRALGLRATGSWPGAWHATGEGRGMTAGEICPTAELHQERSGAEPTKGARAGHDSNHFRQTENNRAA